MWEERFRNVKSYFGKKKNFIDVFCGGPSIFSTVCGQEFLSESKLKECINWHLMGTAHGGVIGAPFF
jgi:hypothetical protein